MKLAFITDTGTGFGEQFWKERGIYCLPLQITKGQETFHEEETITRKEVLECLHQKEVLKTSLPSLGKIEDLFEHLKQEGYEGVFCVPICRGLSGAYDALEMSAKQNDLVFYGVDTCTTAVVEATCIQEAKKLYDQGESPEKIIEKLNQIIQSADTIVLSDDLQHMKRSGRLTPMAATVGELLKIKPILHLNTSTQGRVDVYDKVRTMTKAQSKTIEKLKEENLPEDCYIAIAHVDAQPEAEAFAEKVKEAFGHATVQVIDLVSAVAIHTGLGCLAVQAFNPYGASVDFYQ